MYIDILYCALVIKGLTVDSLFLQSWFRQQILPLCNTNLHC